MGFECRIECDSVSREGVRLTTFVVRFPRLILAEVNTHRMLSRNGASSRAIPVERRIDAVLSDPYVPEAFGRNQRGMQSNESLDEVASNDARCAWLEARDAAVYHARTLAGLGVHKQWAGRLLEPFCWHTAIVSGTDWGDFFGQRCHRDAQPEFQKLACMMRDAMAASTPDVLEPGEWHLPMVTPHDWLTAMSSASLDTAGLLRRMRLVSAGRCARVSYETHDGRRDQDADVALAERLLAAEPPHASPFEHVATPAAPGEPQPPGNFRRWHQWRHTARRDGV